MQNLGDVLLSGGLVAIGVLAAAAADRIRGLRITREPAATRDRVDTAQAPTTAAPSRAGSATTVRETMHHDVVAALIGAGYRKAVAARAVAACTAREQATPEIWAAAALRRCLQDGAS